MTELVSTVAIFLGVLNLILLIKIWQMTNSAEQIKKSIELISDRSATPNQKKRIVLLKCLDQLSLWHRIKKSSNIEKLNSKIDMAFYKDQYFTNLIENYHLTDTYTLDDLKKDCIEKLSK